MRDVKPQIREIEMEIKAYHYTPGPLGLRWLEGIKKGIIMAAKCKKCGNIFIPPKIYCPKCFSEVEDLVELREKPYLASYTIIYRDFNGERLSTPVIVGLVRFKGVDGGLIHYIEGPVEKLAIGASLEPVFRSERRGSITDIEHFRLV